MEKETRITAPEGCEIEKVEIVDGVAVVTFKKKERELPKSWEEYCENFPIKKEFFIKEGSVIAEISDMLRHEVFDRNLLPDNDTAEAVLALCQLIQLRNAFNGDWVPDWKNYNQDKFTIEFHDSKIFCDRILIISSPLYFKNAVLRDEFLCYFRPLIEKLKPLYGIKKGGAE